MESYTYKTAPAKGFHTRPNPYSSWGVFGGVSELRIVSGDLIGVETPTPRWMRSAIHGRERVSLAGFIDYNTKPSMGRVIYTPPGGPPQGPGPSPEIYAVMGEPNIFRMISDLYKELETSEVRHLFPTDMEEASKKSGAFFVSILGGPPLYLEQYGPPRMRARHLRFEIDERARQIWLGCFEKTLEDADAKYGFPQEHLEGFKSFLKSFSAWMVNKL